MNRIARLFGFLLIVLFFAGCKPLDEFNQQSFDLSVVPINTVGNARLDVVTGVACDGASMVELRLNHKSTIVPTSINIKADAKYGTFSQGASNFDCTAIRYTSPALFPGAASENAVNFPITVEVGYGDQRMYYNTALKLIRPPVLMAHGFASSASTFDTLRGDLIKSGNYPDFSLLALDYSATSLASYSTNKDVIAQNIDSLRKNCLKKGYVANKVDVIGHSMGGILSRIYIQNPNYRFDILRLITIDSPHSGTQLADFGMELAANNPGTILSFIPLSGAIRDFQVGSAATQELNGYGLNKVKVPTHVISASYGGDGHVRSLVEQKQFVGALLAYLVDGLTTTFIYDQDNDIVVPVSSQVAGVGAQYATHYDGQWHCSVHTTPAISSRIAQLLALSAKDESSFNVEGFNPPTLTYSPQGAGVRVENFTESAPVVSYQPGTSVRVDFHVPASVASSVFVVTQSKGGKEEIYYMDNHLTGNTTYNFAVPVGAPSALRFHFFGRWDGSTRGDVTYYYSSYTASGQNDRCLRAPRSF